MRRLGDSRASHCETPGNSWREHKAQLIKGTHTRVPLEPRFLHLEGHGAAPGYGLLPAGVSHFGTVEAIDPLAPPLPNSFTRDWWEKCGEPVIEMQAAGSSMYFAATSTS